MAVSSVPFGSAEFGSSSTQEKSQIAIEKRDDIVTPNISPGKNVTTLWRRILVQVKSRYCDPKMSPDKTSIVTPYISPGKF